MRRGCLIFLVLWSFSGFSSETCMNLDKELTSISGHTETPIQILANAQLIRPSVDTEKEFLEKQNSAVVGHVIVVGDEIRTIIEGSKCQQSQVKNSKLSKQIKWVELNGKFLVPGFHDMHVHNYGMNADLPNSPIFSEDGSPVKHLDFPGFAAMNYRMLYSGVTTHLDLMSFNEETKAFRDYQRAIVNGDIKRPKNYLPTSNIYMSGGLFAAEGGHHGDITWLVGKEKETTIYISKEKILLEPDSEKRKLELEKLISKHVSKYRPSVIKLSYDHNPHRPGSPKIASLSRQQLGEFMSAVQAVQPGLGVVCHVGIWQDVEDCVDMGAAAVTHLPYSKNNDPAYWAPEGIFEKMKARDVTVIPTMTTYMEGGLLKVNLFDINTSRITCVKGEENCVCSNEVCTKTSEEGNANGNQHFLTDSLLNQVAPKGLLDHYFNFGFYSGNKWLQWAVEHNKMGYRQENFKKVITSGVRVLSGTDTMWEGTFFGFSLHRELELMHLSNAAVEVPLKIISNMEILATATSNVHEFLGHSRGRLEKGFKADLVVLNSSPIDDIRNTRDIDQVIVNGEIVNREELKKHMAID